MIDYNKLSKFPRLFRYFTGINVKEFNELFIQFERSYDIYMYISNEKRKASGKTFRKSSSGNPSKLISRKEQLLFILIYFKVYPLQFVQGFLFNMDQSNACRWIHKLTNVLEMTLGHKKELPTRNAKSFERIVSECPELNFLIDGSERPINRPKDNKKQNDNYSGKKKHHTRKNIVITRVKSQKIIFLGKTGDGKTHDKKLLEEDNIGFPLGSQIGVDLGFQGLEQSGVDILMPNKKPKGKELTDMQKIENTIFSGVRVQVEHTLSGVKRSRIVLEKLRNRKENFDDQVMLVSCGLHNFRCTSRNY